MDLSVVGAVAGAPTVHVLRWAGKGSGKGPGAVVWAGTWAGIGDETWAGTKVGNGVMTGTGTEGCTVKGTRGWTRGGARTETVDTTTEGTGDVTESGSVVKSVVVNLSGTVPGTKYRGGPMAGGNALPTDCRNNSYATRNSAPTICCARASGPGALSTPVPAPGSPAIAIDNWVMTVSVIVAVAGGESRPTESQNSRSRSPLGLIPRPITPGPFPTPPFPPSPSDLGHTRRHAGGTRAPQAQDRARGLDHKGGRVQGG